MNTAAVGYLNNTVLDAIDTGEFQNQDPFPWVNPWHFVSEERYQVLLDTVPDISRFRSFFGKQRKHGQASHDRYVLDYEQGMELAQPWQDFIDELCSKPYRKLVCRLLGVADVRFRFHWHFTPDGGEVSPHCDSKSKIGSQIFYLNTGQDWNRDWGGETVVLDDGGRFEAGKSITRGEPSTTSTALAQPRSKKRMSSPGSFRARTTHTQFPGSGLWRLGGRAAKGNPSGGAGNRVGNLLPHPAVRFPSRHFQE